LTAITTAKFVNAQVTPTTLGELESAMRLNFIAVIGILATLVAFGLMQGSARAHVVLKNPRAEIGSTYRAVFSVGHGCGGSPTVKLRIKIPSGVVTVEPETKSGWELTTIIAPYDQPYADRGVMIKEGIIEVVWTGLLPAKDVGTFALKADISESLAEGLRLYFPVVQECQHGVERWIDKSDDDSSDDNEHPAPSLFLLPKR
jgi:periplasmic copper chaperone A